jgi:D-alanyl-lipoteichoic acid acyltransferase DltB (MBOAT superfamily)
MNETGIDLYSVRFWVFAGLAILVVTPLKTPAARRWALAAVNLGFLTLLLGNGVAIVALALLAAWLLLRVAFLGGWAGKTALVAIAAATLGLFLIHKLPGRAALFGLSAVNPLLAAIGFSYLALRLIDLTRAVYERRHATPSPVDCVNYLMPFHMLAAGPIQAYDDFTAQLPVPPPLTSSGALTAVELIASGLFKKYVIANYLDQLFLTGFEVVGPYFFIEMQLKFLWLYLDFSAYSDIALGIGQLMGVATPVNFNKPYLARNMIDFWERWHISLSQFIRRNVFLPLQLALMRRTGGKHPLLAASAAFSIAFVLCGLWHSIHPRWVAWGACHAGGLIACNFYKHVLMTRLGRKGVNRYLANRWIRAAAIVLTYEFNSLTFVIVTYPSRGLLQWNLWNLIYR